MRSPNAKRRCRRLLATAAAAGGSETEVAPAAEQDAETDAEAEAEAEAESESEEHHRECPHCGRDLSKVNKGGAVSHMNSCRKRGNGQPTAPPIVLPEKCTMCDKSMVGQNAHNWTVHLQAKHGTAWKPGDPLPTSKRAALHKSALFKAFAKGSAAQATRQSQSGAPPEAPTEQPDFSL